MTERTVIGLLVATTLLGACAQMTVGNARVALNAFCTLKRTDIAQVLLTPAQLQAGEVVCNAIGDPLGTP